MSQFITMLDALAVAVQTLADGGGPFWAHDEVESADEKNRALRVTTDPGPADSSEYQQDDK
ncbi:MAG: hypothetical protein ABI693_30475 [Bryobacteraceae bacterium]